MTLRLPLVIAAAALCLGLVGPVLAQAPAPAPGTAPATPPSAEDALPAGPGRDVVVRVCTACHDASQFAFARYTAQEWDGEIAKMQGAGAEMTAEEQAAISAYLAKNLNAKPDAASAPAADAKPPTNR